MEIGALLLGWGLGLLLCGFVGGMCAESRGRGGAGFLCGVLLGPLGILLALFLPANPNNPAKASPRPGAPVARQRRMPVKPDPLEEFEARERARAAFEQVPVNVRGKKVEEEL